jgi:hypothetical protein
MYSKDIKDKAWKLRKEGKSYNEILKLTSIPKSTLSAWFGKDMGMPFDKKGLAEHLANIRPLAAKMKTKIKLENLERVQIAMNTEVQNYPLKTLNFQKSLLSMLYWAEGSKHEKVSGLKFTNTDPKLSMLFIVMLRNCYQIDENKFRVALQIHYYHSIKKTRKFWSDLLKIPENQFNTVFVKKRSRKKKFRKNFMGICALKYLDSSVRKEILAVGYAIAGGICV